jgi:hypothetical protein
MLPARLNSRMLYELKDDYRDAEGDSQSQRRHPDLSGHRMGHGLRRTQRRDTCPLDSRANANRAPSDCAAVLAVAVHLSFPTVDRSATRE